MKGYEFDLKDNDFLDPRLNEYRYRVAALTERNSLWGYLLVLPEFIATKTKRMAPLKYREIASLYIATVNPESYRELSFQDEELDEILGEFQEDVMRIDGSAKTINWIPVDDQETIQRKIFGLNGFDALGWPLWSSSD